MGEIIEDVGGLVGKSRNRGDCQKETVMNNGEEFRQEEKLKNIEFVSAQGDERREEELKET